MFRNYQTQERRAINYNSLHDIISTSILAMLCGQDDYMGFSLWTQMNLDWLQSVNICKYGAASHDTYERFFAFLNPHSFRTCFMHSRPLTCRSS
ncbi:transposase family protein [Candidatus Rhabdochlamydia oedothoracis]|uniref:transposase family protein n=1 Tax=Candidatus Rhabdochlamydia oedothoracis TaxID=2720720 RepID=UPI001C64680C|nr:transposase family protein [Candidatus Rhabdochlamydia oedothoracis]